MTFFKPRHIEGHLYFITAKINGGKKIFFAEKYCKIVLDCLRWLREVKRMKLFVFVVMPNHVHFIIEPLRNFAINKICHNFESFTAHKILNNLKDEKNNKVAAKLLLFFHESVNSLTDRQHKIWQNLLAKNIYSQRFLEQKIEYIHNNPVANGWRLAVERSDYKYSSACFYDEGENPIIDIDDIREYL